MYSVLLSSKILVSFSYPSPPVFGASARSWDAESFSRLPSVLPTVVPFPELHTPHRTLKAFKVLSNKVVVCQAVRRSRCQCRDVKRSSKPSMFPLFLQVVKPLLPQTSLVSRDAEKPPPWSDSSSGHRTTDFPHGVKIPSLPRLPNLLC